MKYTVYQITNIVNNKTYIGKHQTDDLNDGYMGSGIHLKRAIKKYGIEKFVKQILYVFESEKEMNCKETELVTEEFCLREDTYNICVGGQGGFSHINRDINFRKNKNKKARQVTNNILFLKYGVMNPSQIPEVRKKLSIIMKEKYRTGERKSTLPSWSGKTHREESKKKIGTANAIHQKGDSNSQYGTVWVTNGSENKKVRREDFMPDGWYKGRVIKKSGNIA